MEEDMHQMVDEWSDDPKGVAQQVVGKYGPPDEATSSRLIWFDNDPWKRSVIHRDGASHNFPHEHTDDLEQTIDYGVRRITTTTSNTSMGLSTRTGRKANSQRCAMEK